jgi:hypothetical protein
MRLRQRKAPVATAPAEVLDWVIIDLLRPGSNANRGVLRDLETALRKGRFNGDAKKAKRLALLEAMAVLGASPLSPRTAVRFSRVYALLTAIQDARS